MLSELKRTRPGYWGFGIDVGGRRGREKTREKRGNSWEKGKRESAIGREGSREKGAQVLRGGKTGGTRMKQREGREEGNIMAKCSSKREEGRGLIASIDT